MYRYREDETALVLERIEEFEDQIARRLSGELSEDAFKPLRLMNGLLPPASRLHAAGRHPLRHLGYGPA